MSELPRRIREEVRVLEGLSDDRIDTTDAPEIRDWSGACRGALYRTVS